MCCALPGDEIKEAASYSPSPKFVFAFCFSFLKNSLLSCSKSTYYIN